ncbi:MAG: hypothetical protein P9L94_10425 [Candidatus Hinthialibacter antarcticus]|nr:hypothetical protein [Candidatus Hinthialibacter antarcticus]
MATLKVVEMPYGISVHVSGNFEIVDVLKFNKWLFTPKFLEHHLFIDFGELGPLTDDTVKALLQQFEQALESNREITLVKVPADLKKRIKESGLELPLWKSDSMDEATFPYKQQPESKGLKQLKQTANDNTCPSCNKQVRRGANRCLNCGHEFMPRRSERASVSIPFFYGRVDNKEFLQSEWIGSVTEDLDVDSFSGVGFFSSRPIRKGAEIHFVFPTLGWDSKRLNESTLVIFTGRVKHCTSAGEWHRIGVALIDIVEYAGRFEINTEAVSGS